MATVSGKEIKNRIRSMESTKQITRAMEMVAASKLRHAQMQILASRPYFETLQDTINDIVSVDRSVSSAYLEQHPVKRSAFIVIAGDRGLAGGYNGNVLKMACEAMEGKDVVVLPVGKKALDFFKVRQFPLWTEEIAVTADLTVGNCFSLAKQLCNAYLGGEIQEIYIVYTKFVSVLSQVPEVVKALPLIPQQGDRADGDFLYEPDCESVLEAIVPEYIGGILYGALCESRGAEHAARRTAMNAATQNAQEMIDNLSLKFNQARQAAITQEITEIVAGS